MTIKVQITHTHEKHDKAIAVVQTYAGSTTIIQPGGSMEFHLHNPHHLVIGEIPSNMAAENNEG